MGPDEALVTHAAALVIGGFLGLALGVWLDQAARRYRH